jgi:magnesium transporter
MTTEQTSQLEHNPEFSVTSTPPGSPPGTLVIDPHSPAPDIKALAYGKHEIAEGTITNMVELEQLMEDFLVTWVNVDGLGDIKVLTEIGKKFGIHPLSLEDVANEHQRAKVEYYDNYTFVVLRMLRQDTALTTEQLSMFVAENYVLTFQNLPGDCLDPLRKRIKKRRGKIRTMSSDYLAYSILDAVIDSYFPVLENYGDRLEALEDEILEEPVSHLLPQIHQIKRDLLTMRRAIWPLRDAINSLNRDASGFVTDETKFYLRDCYDHTLRVIDLIETYRQIAADLMDVYLSSVNNKMNEVIKFLTVVSTVFIPPTFIAAVYGMNFNSSASRWNMPELNWQIGYPLCLTLMAVFSLAMLGYLHARGWIGFSEADD